MKKIISFVQAVYAVWTVIFSCLFLAGADYYMNLGIFAFLGIFFYIVVSWALVVYWYKDDFKKFNNEG